MKFTKMAKYWFYGLLISLCLGCAQRTAEEKTLWMVDKLEDELKLNSEQKSQLKFLGQNILEAQSRLGGPQNKGFSEYFEANTFNEKKAMEDMDNQWSQFRAVASDVLPKVGTFYNSLDDRQKEQFRILLADHRHGSRSHSFWGGWNRNDRN